jgi:two-component system, sensor histidine kinase and response regulator
MIRVLLIEDHPKRCDRMLQALQLLNFDVVSTAQVDETFEAVQSFRPDAIICHDQVTMGGFAMMKALRDRAETAAIPFVIILSTADLGLARQYMERGADDVLQAPFKPEELLETLMTRINRHKVIAREAERALEAARGQMMHMVTHELRTPLSSITMVSDIISRQMYSVPVSELRELLETMTSSSKRLSRVVDQIVLITQLSAGILQRSTILEQGMPLSLWETLVASIGLARRFAYRQPNVNIELIDRDKEAQVMGNMLALRHALAELISNALNFSPEGGSIQIAQWISGRKVIISINDSGKGIEQDQLARALQYFEQLDRAHQDQQGMGLGLGLAYGLIEAHGGLMEIASVPNKGTQILITLPLVQQAQLDARAYQTRND